MTNMLLEDYAIQLLNKLTPEQYDSIVYLLDRVEQSGAHVVTIDRKYENRPEVRALEACLMAIDAVEFSKSPKTIQYFLGDELGG